MKASEALRRIFINPGAVFAALRQERKWVSAVIFMVLLLAIHSFVVAVGTYSEKQVGSRIDVQSPVVSSTQDSPNQAIVEGANRNEQAGSERTVGSTKFGDNRSPVADLIFWMSMLVAMLPVGFGFLCLLCIFDAIYFAIISAFLKIGIKLEDWFALSVWSRVPGIALSVLAVIGGLIAFGRQPNSEELEILALTRWVDLPEVHYSGENWNLGVTFDQLDAHLIWIIALQTIGFQQWSGKSAVLSFGIVLAPTLVWTAAAILFILLV